MEEIHCLRENFIILWYDCVSGGKKKGKKKGTKMLLTTFLSNDTSQGSGSSVVYAAKQTNSTSWADESEDLPVHGMLITSLYNITLFINIFSVKSDTVRNQNRFQ